MNWSKNDYLTILLVLSISIINYNYASRWASINILFFTFFIMLTSLQHYFYKYNIKDVKNLKTRTFDINSGIIFMALISLFIFVFSSAIFLWVRIYDLIKGVI